MWSQSTSTPSPSYRPWSPAPHPTAWHALPIPPPLVPRGRYEALKVARQLRTYRDPTPALESLPHTFRLKIYLKTGKEVGKVYQAHKSQRVAELRDLAHGHYLKLVVGKGGRQDDAQANDAPGGGAYTAQQMVLKFVALNEYLDDGEIMDYVTVREKLKQGKPVELRLMPHPFAHAPPLPPAPPPPPPPPKRATSLAMASLPADTFPSVRALSPHLQLRVRIVSLEGCRAATPLFANMLKGPVGAKAANAAAGGGSFPWSAHVTCGIYNGGASLCEEKACSPLPADETSNPQWNEWLTMSMPARHAPQAARACFTVHGKPLGVGKAPLLPVGWVSLPRTRRT